MCASVCIPQVAQYKDVVPQSTCAADERCVPCVSPLDGKPTGACDPPAASCAEDAGPASTPDAAPACPHQGPGGAYNATNGLTVRGGLFYDASVTPVEWTRIDVDTLDKVGLTIGAGYALGALRFNAAWAEIFDLDRVVKDGALRPINGAAKGASVSSTGALLPPVNSGRYSGHAHVIALGVEVVFGARR